MALESLAERHIDDCYAFDLRRTGDEPLQLDLHKAIIGVVEDVRRERAPAVISAKFHNTLAEALAVMAEAARESTRLEVAALSGGVFCNRFLTERLVTRLKQEGFTVLLNRDVPGNDGGLSLGQAAIAAVLGQRDYYTSA
jgi:hydrogenase maturation protein HypF